VNILKHKLNSDAPIAFFDSGVGGLTVLNKVKTILPDENYLYYGDTLHMPYGEKTKSQLLEYSRKILKFFEASGAKAVVMACNTTSSVVYEEIKNDYSFKLFPIVQSVSEILASLNIERLGIFATKATIESGSYQKEIAKYNKTMKVFGQFCPKWVHIVENNTIKESESIEIIKKDLDKMLENNPQKIALGCTHYPFLLDVLSEFAPRDLFIDPSEIFARKIKEELAKEGLLNSKSQEYENFYVSANPKKFQASAKMFYDLKQEPKTLTF
jgi:glutamate racemase